MTVLVGILCADGVVVATDSEATLGDAVMPTVGKVEVQKLVRLNEQTLMAVTGSVGLAQLLQFELGKTMGGGAFRAQKHWQEAMSGISTAIGKTMTGMLGPANAMLPFIGNNRASEGLLAKTLVATVVANQPVLFQFGVNAAPEAATADLPCVSLGAGQPAADRFLAFMRRALWPGVAPSVAEARLVAAWTVRHASQTSTGGVGGPVQLATLANAAAKDGRS